jgi:hypothetical protein
MGATSPRTIMHNPPGRIAAFTRLARADSSPLPPEGSVPVLTSNRARYKQTARFLLATNSEARLPSFMPAKEEANTRGACDLPDTMLGRSACMPLKSRSEILLWSLSPFALLGLYLAAYLLSTEIFPSQLGGTRYRIRLFRSVWHQRIFAPLLATEQRLRPADPEFSGQVRSGASLPPYDESE